MTDKELAEAIVEWHRSTRPSGGPTLADKIEQALQDARRETWEKAIASVCDYRYRPFIRSGYNAASVLEDVRAKSMEKDSK